MAIADERNNTPLVQRLAAVLWPSFIASGIATIIFFTLFDPLEITNCVGGPDISRMGYYSVGFFMFWVLTASTCAFTCYFLRPCAPCQPTDAE